VIERNGNRSVSGLGRVEPERAAAIAGDLGDIEKYLSHGAVMDHEAAMDLGLNVDYLPPDNVLWDAIWRLYCDYVLALARERLMSRSPDLDEAPPFAMTLAHHPGGDAIMLNLNHAAGDGISAVRLMASIVRAYAGEDDPVDPVDPLAVRDIGALAAAKWPFGACVARFGICVFARRGRGGRHADSYRARVGLRLELVACDWVTEDDAVGGDVVLVDLGVVGAGA
jgi:hypothetical protein